MSLDVQGKLAIAKQKKEAADQAFRTGDIKDALRAYHESLLYLNGIDKCVRGPIQGLQFPRLPRHGENRKTEVLSRPVQTLGAGSHGQTQVDEMLDKIYANQSACYIKNGNWKRALESANKALSKNEDNHKAAFRKGKAQAELGYIEKAEKTLGELLRRNPTDAPAINAELARIRAAEAERQKVHDKKLRGFLSRAKDKEPKQDTAIPVASSEPASA
ncbi:hypothetical protein JB92DRAFT_3154882 [Gautieria morchelliformis]|nr:hypothetical protein JB92DRAFT_3154882 [Gautieria morchelliformis]